MRICTSLSFWKRRGSQPTDLVVDAGVCTGKPGGVVGVVDDLVEARAPQTVGEALSGGTLLVHAGACVEEAKHQVRELLVAPDVWEPSLRVPLQPSASARPGVALADACG